MEIARSQATVPRESKPQTSPSQRAVCDALGRLTQRDLADLANFARHQLQAVNLPECFGEDIVQQSILAIAIGARERSQGRHPRPVDVEQHPNFLNYLRGIITSLVESQLNRLENHFPHATWEEWMLDGVPGGEGKADSIVEEEVAFQVLSDFFLQRLTLQAPARLQQLLIEIHRQVPACHFLQQLHDRRMRQQVVVEGNQLLPFLQERVEVAHLARCSFLDRRHAKRAAPRTHPFKSTRYQNTSKTHAFAPTTIIALFREPFSFNGVR